MSEPRRSAPSGPERRRLLLRLLARVPGLGRALAPRPVSFARRLAALPTHGLPLERPVLIRWNEYAVPRIEAESDADAAFALGLVHAHLRETQIALGRRAAQGRLAETAGPALREVDRVLRTLDFGHAAAAIEAGLPEATRAWLQRFADGMNWHQRHVRLAPPEMRLLGLTREPYTVRDILTGGRLVGLDINWGTYVGLLRLRGTPEWPEAWRRALAAGSAEAPSFGPPSRPGEALADLLDLFGRGGSDCAVVAPERSASGAALLAADPHLAQTVPNFWLLVGLRTPGLDVVGLMPPGLPIIGLGRNPWMAWGGTNMRAAQSDLYDVSREPPEAFETREVVLRARFARPKRVTIRRHRTLGPVLTDCPALPNPAGETLALRWVGHAASDEVSAFLAAARARTPEAFRAAFATYGCGGQNMQFATAAGEIGQVMAVHLPQRARARPPDLVLDPADPQAAWQGVRTAADLPWARNPPERFLASANNAPTTEAGTPVGYFFNDPERVRRLQQRLAAMPRATVAEMQALLLDTTSLASRRLCAALLAAIEAAGVGAAQAGFLAALREWNGDYAADSRAPVLFETLLFHVARLLYAPHAETAPPHRAMWNALNAFLATDLDARAPAERARLLDAALDAAARDAAPYAAWGAMHRMRVQSLLARLPVLGAAFVYDEWGAGGSRETVNKTAHGLVRARHTASYGSQARFVADLADPDTSWFVLLGGQDGWPGSANTLDQLPLWRAGGYLRMPLRPESVARDFPHLTRLEPAGKGG